MIAPWTRPWRWRTFRRMPRGSEATPSGFFQPDPPQADTSAPGSPTGRIGIGPLTRGHKPRKLNIVGWFGDSPFLPPDLISQVGPGDPPGFVLYGGKRHPATPASQGHDVQSALRKSKVWSKMVYVDFLGHAPAKRILFSPQTRDRETHQAYLQFLDMVCLGKGNPKAGELIEVAGR